MPFFFALNAELIDSIIGRFIDQFAALPLLVGILSLGAAAVIMANTVALATLERRRQIGILKAIGLKSRRVLSIMLLENLLVSLLGALLGIGLTILGIASLTLVGWEDLALIPRDARPIAVLLVIAAMAIGSASTLLSANPAVRERVLNVLRYE
jgi:putative ABC transport system permease protein